MAVSFNLRNRVTDSCAFCRIGNAFGAFVFIGKAWIQWLSDKLDIDFTL